MSYCLRCRQHTPNQSQKIVNGRVNAVCAECGGKKSALAPGHRTNLGKKKVKKFNYEYDEEPVYTPRAPMKAVRFNPYDGTPLHKAPSKKRAAPIRRPQYPVDEEHESEDDSYNF